MVMVRAVERPQASAVPFIYQSLSKERYNQDDQNATTAAILGTRQQQPSNSAVARNRVAAECQADALDVNGRQMSRI